MSERSTRSGLFLFFLCLPLATPTATHAVSAADNPVLQVLGRCVRTNSRGRPDRKTVRNPAEVSGGTLEGQMYYVPAFPEAGGHPLYRLFNATSDDSMDSVSSSESGYTADVLLGYLLDTQVAGTEPVWRWRHKSTGEYATAFADENLASAGYGKDRILGYAFPRYVDDCERMLSVRGSQVTLGVNQVAGGAVSELSWSGKQFINKYDYGRHIQTAINLSGRAETYNPTEAGDVFGCPGVSSPAWAHGSPLLSVSTRNKTLQTRCYPLNWHPQDFGGGSDNPAMWRGTISKQVDLDFNGSPNVIRWITTVTFPSAESYVDMEIVTAYLNSEFTEFYAYNAQTDRLDAMTTVVPAASCIDPTQDARLRPPAGGVIIATANGAYALGIYRRGTTEIPNLFGLCKFLGNGSTGPFGNQTTKWNALYRPSGGLPAGSYSLTSYLLVGSLDKVVSEARRLYVGGY